MRIFVNNVDGYLAGAVCADLWKLSHNIVGTRRERGGGVIPPIVKKIVPRVEVRRLLKAVAGSDVVVYDVHDADLEELELVLRTLQVSEISHDLTFILISSVGVWAQTQRKYEEVPQDQEAEAPQAAQEAPEAAPTDDEAATSVQATAAMRPLPLTAADHIRRAAAPKFQEWKAIETLVLSLKSKGTVQPYIVCSGIPYGNGEEPLLGLFKAAWQGKQTLRYIGSGNNYIPLVHVRDVARLVRTITEVKPQLEYHIAVDKGDLTQRQFIQSVANEFGISYEIKSVSVVEALLAEFADVLSFDLRFEPSALMSQEQRTSLEDGTPLLDKPRSPSPDQDGAAPESVPTRSVGFRWWCENGLRENMAQVASEFRKWRRLEPVRIMLLGPPGSAVMDLGPRVAEAYNLPLFNFEDMLEEQRGQDTNLGHQIKEKTEEIHTLLSNPKSNGPFLLPVSLTLQVASVVPENRATTNRGFVLAGFPQSIEEAQEFLLEDPPVDKPKTAGESPPPQEGKEKVGRAVLHPDAVVVVQGTDEECLARLQDGGRTVHEAELMKRTAKWRTEFPEEGGGALLELLRDKFGIEPITMTSEEALAEDAPGKISATIDAKRKVFNFMPPVRRHVQDEVEAKPQEAPAEDADQARREAELRRRRREQDERLEQIKREELIRLEKHSEPLRQYLMGLVVPVVTSGLIEVCREQPEDPVGFVAEFLEVYSQVSKARRRQPKRPAGGGAA